MDSISRTHPAFRDAPSLAIRGDCVPELRRSVKNGTLLAEEIIRRRTPVDVQDLLRMAIRHAGRQGPLAIRRIRLAAVLLSAYQTLQRAGNRRTRHVPNVLKQWLRGTATNALTLLLPRLNRRARLALRDAPRLGNSLGTLWRDTYHLAVAAARVAQACLDLGAAVHLATPGERLSLRFDLVVLSAERALCLRILPDAADGRFMVEELPDAEPPYRMVEDTDRLRLGARFLSQMTGWRWTAVRIAVGEPLGIETLSLPRHARRRLGRLLKVKEDTAKSAA